MASTFHHSFLAVIAILPPAFLDGVVRSWLLLLPGSRDRKFDLFVSRLERFNGSSLDYRQQELVVSLLNLLQYSMHAEFFSKKGLINLAVVDLLARLTSLYSGNNLHTTTLDALTTQAVSFFSNYSMTQK